MKSLLSLVLFITLIYGIPFAQNNHQEINQLDEKSIIDPVNLNTQDLKKPKSIEIKSNPQTTKPLSGDLKTDTLSTEDKVYPVHVFKGEATKSSSLENTSQKEPTKEEIELHIRSLESKIETLKGERLSPEDENDLYQKRSQLKQLRQKLKTLK